MTQIIQTLSIPASTTAAAPAKSAEFSPQHRFIYRTRIQIIPNAAAGVPTIGQGVKIFNEETQAGILPPAGISPAQWIQPGARTFDSAEEIDLGGGPYRLAIYGINADAAQAFTVELVMEVGDRSYKAERIDEAIVRRKLVAMVDRLLLAKDSPPAEQKKLSEESHADSTKARN